MKPGDFFIYSLFIQYMGSSFIVGEITGDCEDSELRLVKIFDSAVDVAPLSLLIPITKTEFAKAKKHKWDDDVCSDIVNKAMKRVGVK